MKNFVGREHEISSIKSFLNDQDKHTALVYGIRRVGKTTLINECAKSFNGTVISYFSLLAPIEENLKSFSSQVFETLNLKGLKADSLEYVFDFLGRQKGMKFLIIIDEYQFMKMGEKKLSIDSLIQKIIDTRLGDNTKLIITGSYISIMKELLVQDNPLFGRFDIKMHLKEMDYYDSAKFYEKTSIREKIGYYSVFGGSPNASRLIKAERGLKENIISLILENDAILRSYVENDLLKELGKIDDLIRILSAIGNSKKRYTEISDKLGYTKTSYIDRPLKLLLDVGIIRKVHPINKKNDNKKVFYEISNNLVRFYYTFVYGNHEGELLFMGAEKFYDKRIAPSLDTFISYRFEGIAKEFFSRAIKNNLIEDDIIEIGSYWYDDKETKTNGEFDVAIKDNEGRYSIAEVKFLKEKMSTSLIKEEIQKIQQIKELNCPNVYIISSSGFEYKENPLRFFSGEDLYRTR